MADYPPKKGAAFSFEVPVTDDAGKYLSGAVISSATISKDGGAFAALTNAPTEIGVSAVFTVALTAAEMTCDRFAVKLVVTGQKDITILGETATRQLADLAYPTVSGRSMDVDAAGGVEVGSTQAGALTNASFAIGALDAAAQATDFGEEIADRLLARSIAGGANGGRTVTSALRRIRNRIRIALGVMTVYQEDDATTDHTAAVTTTAGNPISEVDPS